MSSRIVYWRPQPNPSGEAIGHALSHILELEYPEKRTEDWFEVTRSIRPFLRGVIYATKEKEIESDAVRLLDLVDEYGVIELRMS